MTSFRVIREDRQYAIYSEVAAKFGSSPVRNFVRHMDSYDVAVAWGIEQGWKHRP